MNVPELKSSAARGASAPRQPLPAGAWDCHTHVFGPFERFPLASGAKYQPPLAPRETHAAVMRGAGFAHSVVVHPSAYGNDNSAVVDAVAASSGHVHAIVVVAENVSDTELARLHAAGARGIRFTDYGEQPGVAPPPGILSLASMRRMLPRLRELGWQAQIWAKCRAVLDAAGWLAEAGVPIVLDHMGSIDVTRGSDDSDFTELLALIEAQGWWVKLTTTRVTKGRWNDCADVRTFHDAYLERIPSRALWGSDWPYIAMDNNLPDIGGQIDLFDSWVQDSSLREAAFVSNPAALNAAVE